MPKGILTKDQAQIATGRTKKMNLQEIKTAVDNGKIVHWSNELYTVKKSKSGEYNIVCTNGYVIGLTWQDGTTMNGKEEEFYIAASYSTITFHTGLFDVTLNEKEVKETYEEWQFLREAVLALTNPAIYDKYDNDLSSETIKDYVKTYFEENRGNNCIDYLKEIFN